MSEYIYIDYEKQRLVKFNNEEDAEDYWDAMDDDE